MSLNEGASMNTRKADGNNIGREQKASSKLRSLMGALLFGLAWCSADVALGEDGKAPSEPSFEVSVVGSVDNAHWQELDAAHLDGIRGRYVFASELEMGKPWGVILWDEGRGSHSGSSTGGPQPSQQGNNQQRQSLRTTSIR
jgi:hypothetical protein